MTYKEVEERIKLQERLINGDISCKDIPPFKDENDEKDFKRISGFITIDKELLKYKEAKDRLEKFACALKEYYRPPFYVYNSLQREIGEEVISYFEKKVSQLNLLC